MVVRALGNSLTRLSRSLAVHLAWSALVLLVAGILIAAEATTPCPPGGPLDLGACALRPFAVGVVGLAALLYVAGLSGVLAWTSGLRRRGLADARSARDWYLLAAVVGLLATPLLAFTLVSAVR